MSGRGAIEPGESKQGILTTRAVPKVWGRQDLPEPFASELRGKVQSDEPIGEVWFASPMLLDSILVKYLFTSQKLSVQVHPSQDQAQSGEAGKEECWLILDAEPGAELAIGFKKPIAAEQMRAAAKDGSIENLLAWHKVKPGDFFYLPAGTVHAIGAGIALVEVQQSSDTTFRLYDYGRDRPLHLDRAIAVARGVPHDPALRCSAGDQTMDLVTGPHFCLTRLMGQPDACVSDRFAKPLMVLPLAGEIALNETNLAAGSCAYAQSIDDFHFSHQAVALLVAEVQPR